MVNYLRDRYRDQNRATTLELSVYGAKFLEVAIEGMSTTSTINVWGRTIRQREFEPFTAMRMQGRSNITTCSFVGTPDRREIHLSAVVHSIHAVRFTMGRLNPGDVISVRTNLDRGHYRHLGRLGIVESVVGGLVIQEEPDETWLEPPPRPIF